MTLSADDGHIELNDAAAKWGARDLHELAIPFIPDPALPGDFIRSIQESAASLISYEQAHGNHKDSITFQQPHAK